MSDHEPTVQRKRSQMKDVSGDDRTLNEVKQSMGWASVMELKIKYWNSVISFNLKGWDHLRLQLQIDGPHPRVEMNICTDLSTAQRHSGASAQDHVSRFPSDEFTWDDLQQQHEFEAVPEVLLDVLNLRAGLPQVGVAPRRERLGGSRATGNRMGNYFERRVMFVELLSQ